MSHESMFGEEWFAGLEEFDRKIAQAVAALRQTLRRLRVVWSAGKF